MPNAPIYFKRVGKTKTGRGLYKICDPGVGGKVYGRAFTIGKKKARS